MNLDEHLEEIEEDFGASLVDSRAPASIPERRADTSSGALSWLNANGIVAPVIPKKSRWGSDDADQRAMNLINKVTETYYGKKDQNKPAEKQYFRNAPVKQSSQPQPQMAAPPMMPPPGFFPPPMFIPPPMPGLPPLPIPPGMPFPGMAAMMPPPGQVITPPKKASPPVKKPSSGRFNSPYRRGRSRSRSPRRRSRSRSPPRRRRSSSSSPPLRRRSPDLSEGITTTGMTMDERRKFEENKIFVKLLLSKLLAIKSTQRLESLHVGLMSMVKKAIDDDVAEQHLRLQR